MANYAKEVRNRVDWVRDDVIPPVAKNAAHYTERLADGSEAFAESARRMAEMTRQWADEVSGVSKRRTWMWTLLAFTVVGIVGYFMSQSNGN